MGVSKMNQYYHEFVLGWNWWMLEAFIMVVFMVFLGIKQYYMTSDLKIRGRYNEKLFALVATVGAIIFGLMVFFESADGVIQYFDNHLSAGESAVWSLIFAPFAIIFASLLFFLALYGIAVLASWAREGYLCSKRREIIRERKNRAKIAEEKGRIIEANFRRNQEVQNNRALHCV